MTPLHRSIALLPALALVGCLTFAPKNVPEPASNPVAAALEQETLAVLDRSVRGTNWRPDIVARGVSGASTSGPGAAHSDRRFIYEFRCVGNEPEVKQTSPGWLLPVSEHSGITNSTHEGLGALIVRAGGVITRHSRTDSTFELDYTFGPVVGRVRGVLASEATRADSGQKPTSPYTLFEVTLHEETAPSGR